VIKSVRSCGTDKKFVWAEAKIEGNNVLVWNDEIANPVYVRFAWSDNPEGAICTCRRVAGFTF